MDYDAAILHGQSAARLSDSFLLVP